MFVVSVGVLYVMNAIAGDAKYKKEPNAEDMEWPVH